MRSLLAAACPLFETYMFKYMGVNWACTLLGCIAAVLAPVPFIFIKYGARIRAKSKWVPQTPPPAKPARDEEEAKTGDDTDTTQANGEEKAGEKEAEKAAEDEAAQNHNQTT